VTLNRRMTLTVAFACALSSTVLYPLFIGTAWFYAGLGAIIVAAASGALSRLRTLPVLVCLGIGVLGLLLYLNLVFEAPHSWLLVIPTPGSISRLWDLAGTGTNNAHIYSSPAPELPGLVLAAAAGIGITAVVTDLIAVRLRSTALAGLPLLVLFTVPVTMNAQHEGLGTAVVFCLGTAGYLAMLSADGRERIRVWGRLVSLWRSGSVDDAAARRGPRGAGDGAYAGMSADGETRPAHRITGPEPGPDTRALAAAGRRVGLASVILALCVPLLVPGLHASKLLSSGPGIGGTGGTGGAAVSLPDTLTQTMRELQESHPTKVLTYTTDASEQVQADGPPYLQTYVYDTLTDSGWQTSGYTAGEAQASTIPSPPGLNDEDFYHQFKISVNVAGGALTNQSAPSFLAVPYPATQVTTPPGVWLVDPELMVFSQNQGADVQTYSATSVDVDPTAAQLRAAPRPPAGLAADLELPASYKQLAALTRIAKQETAGQTTEFDKVDALANWLSGPAFAYDAAAPPVNSAATLLKFLTTNHAGVCVQSAWAMTVLTRLLGIPARMAGGFTGGTHLSGSTYVVKTDDAHAWAEVYFSGYGWIKFEATPSGGDGTARASTYQGKTSGSTGSTSPAQGSPGLPAGPIGSTRAGLGGINKLVPNNGGSGGSTSAKSAGTPWAAIALAIIAAIALACGVIAIVAPPTHRALSAHAPEGAVGSRRRRPASLPSVVLVVAAAAIVALALYRLLSHTSGLDLRAGWATVGIAFGAACVFAFVAPGVSRIGIRRWRWLRAGDDASRAHTAWHEFCDDLQDLGLGYTPSEPPRTLADRVTAGLSGPAREAVRKIALAEERASYAARPSGSATLRRDGAAARRGIAASVRRGSRWRARIFPTSVMTAAADSAARVPDRLAALVSRRWTERGSTS
jgi:transglutaminase-like putative cysteine protease